MAFFPQVNYYTNEDARNAWFSVFAIFAVWWAFSLLSGLFHRPAAAPGGVAAGAGGAVPTFGGKLERITTALERIFISSFAVVTFNYLTNGITKNFNIILWIALWIGFFWALAIGIFSRFGHLLQFLVIPLFVLLWSFAFVHRRYIGGEFW